MNKREDILKFVNTDDKTLYIKIIDYIGQVQKYYEPRFTHFLDPAQMAKVSQVINQFDNIKYISYGGIANSERKIIAIYPSFMEEDDIKFPITALCIRGSTKFERIEHRDILGSIMNLGIKREKLGDIVLDKDSFYVIIYEDISCYIKINLSRIRHVAVEVDYININDVPLKEEKYKEISVNIASMRLDAVLSAGFSESRSSLHTEITRGNVKLNWEETKDASKNIREGDIISLKGRGRIVIEDIGNVTKKGRINVLIKRFI